MTVKRDDHNTHVAVTGRRPLRDFGQGELSVQDGRRVLLLRRNGAAVELPPDAPTLRALAEYLRGVAAGVDAEQAVQP